MYQLYERVEKSDEYMYGSKPIENNRNPFLEGPCLLCISAQLDNVSANKSNFGITKQGMQMARLRVRGQQNAGFTLNDFPVKFLSMKLDHKDEEEILTPEERREAFAKKYLLPLISKDGQKIDYEQAMRNMRNVNIMCYCNGTMVVQDFERILINEMQSLGYTSEECDKIQSQMCMFPISTDKLNGSQKSTCISFKDINDAEVSDNVTEGERRTVKQSQIGESVVRYSDNEIAYLFNGDGEHSLKKYAKVGAAMPVCLSSVVSKALENSLENFSRADFTPVTTQLLTADIESIMQKAADGINTNELMQNLDANLVYGGARRISKFEAQLLDQLDGSFDARIKAQRELDYMRSNLNSVRTNLERINEAMEQNCSEVNYWKILVAAGYQLPMSAGVSLEDVLNSPSDKALIAEIKDKARDNDSAHSNDVTVEENEHLENAAKLQKSIKESRELSEEITALEAQKGRIY